MIEYMNYVIKSLQSNNDYEHLTLSSRSLLNFKIPNAFKFQLSNKSTPYTYNTIDISTNKVINGSITYLYTDAKGLDKLIKDSHNINIQSIVETYNHHCKTLNINKQNVDFKSLYYGRMYYPNSHLEGMIIKKFTTNTQVVLKWVSSFNSCNIITGYFQKYGKRNFQELIVSSNDFLCGYRFLHNFIEQPSKLNNSLYNNSYISLGGEFWLAISTLSPTCATTLRYCTHSATTGRPLTLTLSFNPLFGHLSSTYSAKTSSNSAFCVQYDFNLYSIDSNLSLGCELWKQNELIQNVSQEKSKKQEIQVPPNFYNNNSNDAKQKRILNDLNTTFESSLKKIDKERAVIENFETDLYNKDFTSVWKFSTSLRDKNLCILWDGKFKGFLLSAGTELIRINTNNENNSQSLVKFYPAKLGLQLQFST
ncbi:hypothetical protein Kpol_1070p9 [Vanderwaltozyma polyspora DSM 70294]|uniref:Mitochondrial distribution and morphology protein 10 n=1 Tax=Vanderwaltozyma polyspora (strain ATCC 22028 / DSM 70294 / BCRC 21397 / CBS 2163 / NBRC 10782 / NRRL Y-8283 / UCD 57-17) TaxID=436907 RepID=MDM10_VANPO|nr:uncharacterized protein Kpol_1070p9 [Vanderwaltozyma polyspora DSM 70294]A7TNL0.1 RecName: Full=Mitochondrial distribution and morphology protein 10; AltName: Full=Mitochondrial inheritance component MDM10 [Vanderwaltozyma polyspora DSM 70294]EDO16127.1 hypothetical protein Kpol_1070p9 [Vanderwaltozyma polyspora DSM 70294]